MQRFFTFLLCNIFLFSNVVYGQTSASKVQISGVVLDDKTSKPISFVQVGLFQDNEETGIKYVDTDINGSFSMTASPGRYTLKLYLLGYEDKVIPNIDANKNIDLGDILLSDESQQLSEVEIVSKKLMMRTNVEGLVINPDQNLSNIGGTLLDILRNTPSVSVGDDGSVSLRGSSGTNVLINGRNSSLTQNLERIPASAIEQIKIINNPNARYDAEAEAGIIDIVLKKGENLGTNGGIEAMYGSRDRMNIGGQLNHRELEYNIYAGYNFRQWNSIGIRRIERDIFDDNELLNQETASQRGDKSHNFTYGADYYFGKNILSYEGVFSSSFDERLNNLTSNLSDKLTGGSLRQYRRVNDQNETDDRLDNALIYERTFDDKERSFKFIASQSYTNQFKTQNIDIFRDLSSPGMILPDDQEKAITDEKRYGYIIQADYIHPLTKQMKIETGIKSNIRKFTYDYDFLRFDQTNEEFLEDPAISNRFDYSDEIYAAYAIYSKSGTKFDFTVGVRGEYTVLESYSYNIDEQNSQNYFNLFPSLQSLYRFTDKHAAKFTYSRRIDRPRAWRLNPFPDITDSLNVRRGNPNLQPEMINSFELGYIYEEEKSSLTANLFFRQVNGQLDFITIVEDGISYRQPENLNNSESYGIEIIGFKEFTSWWTFSGSVTGFGINVDGTNVSSEFSNQGYALNSKLTSDFKLPFGINLQLIFNYDSPEVEAQGRDLEQYYLDLSLQKSFLDNRASLTISVRDIFDTRRFAGFTTTNSFSQSFYSKRETRILLLSARYTI